MLRNLDNLHLYQRRKDAISKSLSGDTRLSESPVVHRFRVLLDPSFVAIVKFAEFANQV
jgi:hypothetical protein